MKNLLFIFLLFFTGLTVKADQLSYLSLGQAAKAVEYLRDQKNVILWCACCDNDAKEFVSIEKVYYKKVGYKDYYQVMLEGKTLDGRTISQPVDLAYVHVKLGKKYKNLGKVLKFECDPCTKPFKWLDGID